MGICVNEHNIVFRQWEAEFDWLTQSRAELDEA